MAFRPHGHANLLRYGKILRIFVALAWVLSAFAGVPLPAHAQTPTFTVTENFSTTARRDADTTTAVWDASGATIATSTDKFALSNSGMEGGFVLTVAYSPNFASDSTVFSGNNPGFAKSTDSGATWTDLTSSLPTATSSIQSISVSPNYSSDSTLFAVLPTVGIYKSTNGGTMLTSANSGISDPTALQKVAVSSNYATDSTVFLSSTSAGVYKTTNGGTSWSQANTGLSNLNTRAIAVSSAFATDSTAFVGTSAGTMFKTTDGGSNWSALSGFPSSMGEIRFISMASSTTLFVGTASGGVRRSTDGGDTWTAVNNGFTGTSIHGLSVSPAYATDSTVFMTILESANRRIFKTTSTGSAWYLSEATTLTDTVTTAAQQGWVTEIALAPNYGTSSQLLVGTMGAATYRSTDAGVNWTQTSSGMRTAIVWSVAFAPNFVTSRTLFAATANGIMKSTDAGVTWSRSVSGVSNRRFFSSIAVSPNYASDSTVFAGDFMRGVFKSTDGGSTWTEVAGVDTRVFSIAISPNYASDSTVFIAVGGAGGIYKTTNGGTSWSAATTGFSGSSARSIVVSPNYATDSTVWVVDNNGVIYKSTDAAANWSSSTTVSGTEVLVISPNYASDSTVFGGVQPGTAGLVRTTTSGTSWSTLQTTDMRIIGVSRTYSTDSLVVGTSPEAGIATSTDSGANFISVSTNQGIGPGVAGTTFRTQAIDEVSRFAPIVFAPDSANGAGYYFGGMTGMWRNFSYFSAEARTVNLSTVTDAIASVTLSYSASTNGGTVTAYISIDGGTNWNTMTSGQSRSFGREGSDLRVRFSLAPDTPRLRRPTVSSFTVSWTHHAPAGAPKPPNAPTALGGEALSSSAIRWKFQDNATDEVGFVIVEKLADGTEAVRAQTNPNIAVQNLSFLDETGLLPNAKACNRVARARGINGESQSSDLYPCVTTLASTPGVVSLSDLEVAGAARMYLHSRANPSATEFTVGYTADATALPTTPASSTPSGVTWITPQGIVAGVAQWVDFASWGGYAGFVPPAIPAGNALVAFTRNLDGVVSASQIAKIPLAQTSSVASLRASFTTGTPALSLAAALELHPMLAAISAVATVAMTGSGVVLAGSLSQVLWWFRPRKRLQACTLLLRHPPAKAFEAIANPNGGGVYRQSFCAFKLRKTVADGALATLIGSGAVKIMIGLIGAGIFGVAGMGRAAQSTVTQNPGAWNEATAKVYVSAPQGGSGVALADGRLYLLLSSALTVNTDKVFAETSSTAVAIPATSQLYDSGIHALQIRLGTVTAPTMVHVALTSATGTLVKAEPALLSDEIPQGMSASAAEIAIVNPDTTPPETTITKAPPALSSAATESLVFTSSEPATFACTLDTASSTACISPYATPELGDGAHTFAVAATDAAGNSDQTPATAKWTTDRTAPVLSGISASSGVTTSTIAWSTNENSDSTVEYGVGAYASSTASATRVKSHTLFLVGLSPATAYQYRVKSTDAAGNTAASGKLAFTTDAKPKSATTVKTTTTSTPPGEDAPPPAEPSPTKPKPIEKEITPPAGVSGEEVPAPAPGAPSGAPGGAIPGDITPAPAPAPVALSGAVLGVKAIASAPVEGARVTLEQRVAGEWVAVDAAEAGTANPQITEENGAYSFAVLSGTYRVRAEAKGFKPYESVWIEVTQAPVLHTISLLPETPTFAEFVKPDAPIQEQVAQVSKVIAVKTIVTTRAVTQEIKKVVDNPAVEHAAETVVAPVTTAAAIASTGAALPLAPLALYLRYAFLQPVFLLWRRKRKEWGVAYNALTKRPLDLTLVRLIDAKEGKLVQSRVTDKNGRYAFFVQPGTYRIEAYREGFIYPSLALKQTKDDGRFLDLYHGEPISVDTKGGIITVNIPMDPRGEELPAVKVLRTAWLRKVQHAVGISGVALAITAAIINPSPAVLTMVWVHLLLYALFRHFYLPARPKSFGVVRDLHGAAPLPFAVARIFDTEYHKLLETQVTDKYGRYAFLVGPNKYYVTYEKPAYEKKKTGEIDMTGMEEGVIARDEKLARARAKKAQRPRAKKATRKLGN